MKKEIYGDSSEPTYTHMQVKNKNKNKQTKTQTKTGGEKTTAATLATAEKTMKQMLTGDQT